MGPLKLMASGVIILGHPSVLAVFIIGDDDHASRTQVPRFRGCVESLKDEPNPEIKSRLPGQHILGLHLVTFVDNESVYS
jgi:hypothetical protein